MGSDLKSPIGHSGVRSKVTVLILLFFIRCLLLLPLYKGCVWSLFCSVILSVRSSFVIIPLRKRELGALI